MKNITLRDHLLFGLALAGTIFVYALLVKMKVLS